MSSDIHPALTAPITPPIAAPIPAGPPIIPAIADTPQAPVETLLKFWVNHFFRGIATT